MNADVVLAKVASILERHQIDAILIGNAAAALQGAPVSTVDLDFFIRKTPANEKRLKHLAADLGAVLFRPHYPVSGLIRIMRDDDGLQLDFMTVIDGIRSFESLRSRARTVSLGGTELKVAALADIIKSKEAAGRDRDLAVLPVLRKVNEEASDPQRKTRRPQEGKRPRTA
ncbi:MAG: nucleotidyltransferase [Acidobacteria bacterium]|nr:nucleotidyltransferase [Acidobacteriota bacterium]